MDAEWRSVVQKFEGAGLVTVENTSGVSKYGTVFFGAQALLLHDCQHRSIDDFKWEWGVDCEGVKCINMFDKAKRKREERNQMG